MKNQTLKVHKKLFIWILIILLIPTGVLYFFYCFLPRLIEAGVPPIAKYFGITKCSIQVNKATWDDVDLREVRIESVNRPGVNIKKIRFLRSTSYSMPNSVNISGAVINIDSLKGKVFIPGITISSPNPDTKESVPLVRSMQLPGGLGNFLKPGVECKIRDSEIAVNEISTDYQNSIKLPIDFDFGIDRYGFFVLKVNSVASDLHDIPFLLPGISCRQMRISVNAEGTLKQGKAGRDIFAKFAIDLKDIKFSDDDKTSSIPSLVLSGTLWQDGDDLVTKLILQIKDADFAAGNVKLSQINGELPFLISFNNHLVFPENVEDNIGELKIGKLKVGNKDYGNAVFKYNQCGSRLIVNGGHSGLINGRSAVFDGEVKLPFQGNRTSVVLNAVMDCPGTKIDLGKFVSQLSGMIFDGNAKLKSDLKYEKDKLSVSAGVKIKNGRIGQESKGLVMENIGLDFNLPDLMVLKSAPAQKMTFDSLKLGELKFQNGELQFQLESNKTFFLEKSDIEWCDGHIDFGAVRMDFDRPENIDCTLYCDRINVAELLNQLTVAHGSGNGEVTGRIPVIFQDGHLDIKDGFLYSTPGEGAIIKLLDFKGSDIAESNVQLAIAKEALKDFNYKWIRLNFHTENKNLLLKLELDGAPSENLPFTFDLKKGIRKSDNPEQKAKFQGIGFEINYNLPIDDLIYYGRKGSRLFKFKK